MDCALFRLSHVALDCRPPFIVPELLAPKIPVLVVFTPGVVADEVMAGDPEGERISSMGPDIGVERDGVTVAVVVVFAGKSGEPLVLAFSLCRPPFK